MAATPATPAPAWEPPPGPRRVVTLLGGLLVVVVVAALVARVQAGPPPQLEIASATTPATASAPEDIVVGSWREWAEPALAGRAGHIATWAGSRVFVYGGRPDPGTDRFLAAAVTGDAEVLPPGPLGGRYGHSALWTGRVLVVLGGARAASPDPAETAQTDAAIFDPDAGTWRAVGSPGIALALPRAAVWTGTEVIVVGRPHRGAGAAAATLDPDTGQWSTLPRPPLGSRPAPLGVWTGSEMLVWNGHAGGPAAALDPLTRRWRAFDPAPQSEHAFVDPAAVWTGGAMVVTGRVFGADAPAALALDSDGAWRRLPDAPLSGAATYAATWGGDRLYLVGGSADAVGAALRGSAWSRLAPAPIAATEGHALVWTGHELVVVGGRTNSLATAGAAFDPT